NAAIEWLEKPRSGPFYLYLNLQQTHYAYRLPPGVAGRFGSSTVNELQARGHEITYFRVDPDAQEAVRLAYDDALHFVDTQIGRLHAALEAMGELDDTLLVITADHGESFGEAGVDTHGKTLREPEARPPLLFYFPSKLPARDVYEPISHLDVMPTVLDILGLPSYPGHQGATALGNAGSARDARGVFLTMQGLRHADAVVCYPWKFVHDRSGRKVELYNLERDPGERRNLAGSRSTIRTRLEAVLDAQIKAQLDYHAQNRMRSDERFAPRLASCPELPR
ncbi:MAG: sulfatase-like hydrolase/transferase, partial [Polyangiaceae bacterium]|nr:sulfatase-like hydrolase/transferase [Polyangiaceae bacterium]